MTLYEKLMNGTKEDLIHEFVLVAKWARELSNADWNSITIGQGGLEKFVQDTLDRKYIDVAPTHNKDTCKYVYRTFEDLDGPQYWCRLYDKDCDNCNEGG